MPTHIRDALRNTLSGQKMTRRNLESALHEAIGGRVFVENVLDRSGRIEIRLRGVEPDMAREVTVALQDLIPMGVQLRVEVTREEHEPVYGFDNRMLGMTSHQTYADATITIGGVEYPFEAISMSRRSPAPAEGVVRDSSGTTYTVKAQSVSKPKPVKRLGRYEQILEMTEDA